VPTNCKHCRAIAPTATRDAVSRALGPFEHVANVVETVLDDACQVRVAGVADV